MPGGFDRLSTQFIGPVTAQTQLSLCTGQACAGVRIQLTDNRFDVFEVCSGDTTLATLIELTHFPPF
ncbi:hypothetical protein D3C84_1218350 [compost metagenome]